MNLYAMLQARAAEGRPVRVGRLIGAGKFGSMFLAQTPATPGLVVAAIADLDPERARASCRIVGWDDAAIAQTQFLDSGEALCREDLDVVIEATGNPAAGVEHALATIEAGRPG